MVDSGWECEMGGDLIPYEKGWVFHNMDTKGEYIDRYGICNEFVTKAWWWMHRGGKKGNIFRIGEDEMMLIANTNEEGMKRFTSGAQV